MQQLTVVASLSNYFKYRKMGYKLNWCGNGLLNLTRKPMRHDIEIITDNKWKPLLSRHDVPEKVLHDQFDWLEDDDDYGFFKYRGRWYHQSEFMVNDSYFPGRWHGYHSDSAFSGVLLLFSDDYTEYKVGTYFS